MAEEQAPPAQKKPVEKKPRQPSAVKRNLQSKKRRLRNRSLQATVLTAVRGLEASISQKQGPEAIKQKLGKVYSLMDKGVKKGIYKRQKAARTKSRLSARAAV